VLIFKAVIKRGVRRKAEEISMTVVLFIRKENCRELSEDHKYNKIFFFGEALIVFIPTSSNSALSNYIKFLFILT
jgi:hypothetical protein